VGVAVDPAGAEIGGVCFWRVSKIAVETGWEVKLLRRHTGQILLIGRL
jgi:hypothetical protein